MVETRVSRVLHQARVGVRKIILVAVTQAGCRRRKRTPAGTPPRRPRPLRAARPLLLIGLLFQRIPFPRPLLQHGLGLSQSRQAVRATRDLILDDQPVGALTLIQPLRPCEQLLHRGAHLRLALQQPRVAHGFALGGVGVEFGPVQADGAQGQHARLCGQHKHLDEQRFERGQEGAPKGGQRIVVGVQVASNVAKRHRLVGRALDRARPEYAGGITIEQQAQQHRGGVGFPATGAILRLQQGAIKQVAAIHHEAGQVLGRQTLAQAHRQIKRRLVIHGFEGSTHTRTLPLLRGRRARFSPTNC